MHSELTQTGRFARFVETFRYEQIPPDVVERTKDVIYDGIGALLSATSPKYDIGAVLSRCMPQMPSIGDPRGEGGHVNGNSPVRLPARSSSTPARLAVQHAGLIHRPCAS